MNLINFITRSKEKAFIAGQVEILLKELPPAAMSAEKGRISVNKVTRSLERVYTAASDFKNEHQVGVIGRAAMANAFKWGLLDASYSSQFADMATEGLIVALSKKK